MDQPEPREFVTDLPNNDTIQSSDIKSTSKDVGEVDNYDNVDKSPGEALNISTNSVTLKEDDELSLRQSAQLLHHLTMANNNNNNTNNEQTVIDLMSYWIQGFFGPFYTWWGNTEEGEDREKLIISDDEIDQLAVFQGSVTDYLQLHEGQVAPRKIFIMQALLNDDNHGEWERRCIQLMPRPTFQDGMIRILESCRAKLKAYLGTWNHTSEHCSENIYLLNDGLTVQRFPTVNQTDAVRSKLGVMVGVHAWDLKVTGPIGTHFSVGLATEKAPLNSTAGYVSLIGDDEESWGWDVVWGNLSHNGKTIGHYPRFLTYEYTPGDTIRLIVDRDKGDMSFAANEKFLGDAFKKLPKDVPLYPTVGLVFGNMEVSLLYLGVPPPLRNDNIEILTD